MVKSLEKQPLGKQRRKWEDNIKIDYRRMCCQNGKGMELVQDHVQLWTLVLTVLNLEIKGENSVWGWFAFHGVIRNCE
jgi:hypothetical protein